jgi:hypothetical protein
MGNVISTGGGEDETRRTEAHSKRAGKRKAREEQHGARKGEKRADATNAPLGAHTPPGRGEGGGGIAAKANSKAGSTVT